MLQQSDTEELKRRYNETDLRRLEYQKRTQKYIAMNRAYDACISKALDKQKCLSTLNEIEDEIDTGLSRLELEATPTQTIAPKEDLDITIQQNIQVFPQGRRHPGSSVNEPYSPSTPSAPPTPYFAITPRNSFTPAPGFTPQNKYQAGDGFR